MVSRRPSHSSSPRRPELESSTSLRRISDVPVQVLGHRPDAFDLRPARLGEPARPVPQGVLEPDPGIRPQGQGDRADPYLRGTGTERGPLELVTEETEGGAPEVQQVLDISADAA